MTLNEAAAAMGVETRLEGDHSHPNGYSRPSLDIAMECLGKLPAEWADRVQYRKYGGGWYYLGQTYEGGTQTFEDCVCKLVERHTMEGK